MPASVNFRMLRLARELRGQTQLDLTRRTQIAQARLSRIETGQVQPGADELAAISDVLDLPVEFFFAPCVPAAAPLFRKRAIRSVRRLTTLQARLNLAVMIAQRLIGAGVEIDAPLMFPEPGEFDPHHPERAAQAMRRNWRVPAGPIDDLTALIESAGGIVLRVDFGTDDATAAFISTQSDGRLWFLVNSRETAGDRVRLSLAHELGHAVLHRMLPAYDEGEGELQAFTFAAALLLPDESFDRRLGFNSLTLSEARSLKRHYGVSLQAIVRTAYLRGLISRPRYTSLFKQLSARQWRMQEPDSIDIEEPFSWPSVVTVHRAEHGFDDIALARIAHVYPHQLSDLFPENFSSRHLRVLPPAIRSAASAAG
jgi:Zn-dependent peptidase ImmA (M78 family)